MSDNELTLRPLYTWRSAITDSELPPVSRHVALTLSLHMNERGGSCFPGSRKLADETGLSRSTVIKHLEILAAAGWLEVEQGWGRNNTSRYTAAFPKTSISRTISKGGPDELKGPGHEIKGPADTHKRSGSDTRGLQEDFKKQDLKPSPKEPDGSVNARNLTSSFVDAYRKTHRGNDPAKDLTGRVASWCKQNLGAGKSPEVLQKVVTEAAERNKSPGLLSVLLAEAESGHPPSSNGYQPYKNPPEEAYLDTRI